MGKYICPQCGSQLLFWTETVLERKYKINCKTGRINKTPCKQQTYGLCNATDNEGFVCENCGYILNTTDLPKNNNYDPDDIEELLKRYPEGDDGK